MKVLWRSTVRYAYKGWRMMRTDALKTNNGTFRLAGHKSGQSMKYFFFSPIATPIFLNALMLI